MRLRRLARRGHAFDPLLAVALGSVLVACQASGSTQVSTSAPAAASPATSVAPPPSASSSQTAVTARPVATPLPVAVPRPTDLPTDGTCEEEHSCLGVIAPGSHHTAVFSPGFSFSVASAGWENLEDAGGNFGLESTTTPGDAIFFFRRPRATTPDGEIDSIGGSTSESLTAWLAANKALTVTPAKAVTIGGLSGSQLDVAIAPGETAHQSDCPVQVCVLVFKGKDPSSKPTWEWDWGSAGPELQRFYLLQAPDDSILIAVDSLDGTTFDSLTKEGDAIVASLNFDKPSD